MRVQGQRGLTPWRLRLFLAGLFAALAVPLAVLVVQAQRQIQWESLHQHRVLAEEVTQRIDRELQRLVAAEEARAYADYRFLVVAGDPATSSYVQRSPLAAFPVRSEIPGLVGWFQVDAAGALSTPLLPEEAAEPAALGIGAEEWAQRQALRARLLEVLGRHALVARRRDALPSRDAPRPESGSFSAAPSAPAPTAAEEERAALAPAQEAFDRLNAPAPSARQKKEQDFGRLSDLRLDDADGQGAAQQRRAKLESRAQAARVLRKEQTALLENATALQRSDRDAVTPRIRLFESEIAPFELALLDSGHFVLFRKVWRDGQRTVQGALLERDRFVQEALAAAYRESALAPMSSLAIAFQGEILQTLRGAGPHDYLDGGTVLLGSTLYQARLSAPLDGFQLLWTVQRLPPGPGAGVVTWSSVVLLGVLIAGFLALYRLGMRQMSVARQQRDFISAVSHELKTPLTSIRMYGEMLREGWVGEDKKREYYRFIHDEAERLSRLIANVLQLARMERNDLPLQAQRMPVSALIDMLRSRVQSQVERAGFECSWTIDSACADAALDVDPDAFTQIFINLIDNALKFAAAAPRKTLKIAVRPRTARRIVFSLRDYGPGVPKAEMRKIFQLFYRAGSELTRETVGTGIGLALVRQLAQAMGGEVNVSNCEPGAEFEVVLPVAGVELGHAADHGQA